MIRKHLLPLGNRVVIEPGGTIVHFGRSWMFELVVWVSESPGAPPLHLECVELSPGDDDIQIPDGASVAAFASSRDGFEPACLFRYDSGEVYDIGKACEALPDEELGALIDALIAVAGRRGL